MARHLAGIRRFALVLAGMACLGAAAAATEITGVQPYALDQPRVPAMLVPADGGAPLSYASELTGQRVYAFDWYLDTAASRIALSRSARDTLGVQAAGGTVEDWGIAGTETFDVSAPYLLCVGDSGADPADPRQFPFVLRCAMELRQSDQSALSALPKGLASSLGETAQSAGLSQQDLAEMLTPSINVVGTPFLQEHVVVLDPRPVAAAMGFVLDLLQGGGARASNDPVGALGQLLGGLASAEGQGGAIGEIRADVLAPGQTYPEPKIIVPLAMKQMTDTPLPVADAPVPLVAGVKLENGGRKLTATLALDTGGAVSIISTQLARKLGLDLEHPDMKAPLMGVGQGAPEVKGYWLTSVSVPTAGGEPLVYRRAPYFVADVKGIDGTVGANLLVPSVYIDLSANILETDPMGVLSSIRQGAAPFSRIVLDLPHKRLGLDPTPAPAEQLAAPGESGTSGGGNAP
jgi:hypothetical protein